MRTTPQILASYRDAVRTRFFEFIGRKTQNPAHVPRDPKEAMKLGIALGRQQGYGSGLVDGTQLGLDVGLETVDEMLTQPVILSHPGRA